MRASAIVGFGVLTLGSVLAIPSQFPAAAAAAAAIDKRQTAGGDSGSEGNFGRPAEWENLTPLPRDIARAYERNVQTDALAYIGFELTGNLDSDVNLAQEILYGRTYLTPMRIRDIVMRTVTQIIEWKRAGLTTNSELQERLTLGLQQLEQEMAEIVRFRRENERLGSPGQETWRYPYLKQEGQPDGLVSPYHSLTETQDFQLIIAKARSGRFTDQQLLDYLLSQDPFLADHETYAATLIRDAYTMYKFEPEPNMIGRWFRRIFGTEDA